MAGADRLLEGSATRCCRRSTGPLRPGCAMAPSVPLTGLQARRRTRARIDGTRPARALADRLRPAARRAAPLCAPKARTIPACIPGECAKPKRYGGACAAQHEFKKDAPGWYEEMYERQRKAHPSRRIRVEHGIVPSQELAGTRSPRAHERHRPSHRRLPVPSADRGPDPGTAGVITKPR